MRFPYPSLLPKAEKKGQHAFPLSCVVLKMGSPGQQHQLGASELEIAGFEQALQVVLMHARFENRLTRPPTMVLSRSFSMRVLRRIQDGSAPVCPQLPLPLS